MGFILFINFISNYKEKKKIENQISIPKKYFSPWLLTYMQNIKCSTYLDTWWPLVYVWWALTLCSVIIDHTFVVRATLYMRCACILMHAMKLTCEGRITLVDVFYVRVQYLCTSIGVWYKFCFIEQCQFNSLLPIWISKNI